MIKICAWCGAILHEEKNLDSILDISHGICQDCLDKFIADYEELQ